jgi:hypothetical protein
MYKKIVACVCAVSEGGPNGGLYVVSKTITSVINYSHQVTMVESSCHKCFSLTYLIMDHHVVYMNY